MKDFQVPLNKDSLPSRGLSSSYQIWLDQKRENDSKLWNFDKNYWIINNKVYDLTSFIQKHPGGSHWIQYTKGHNITEHYLVHHLDREKSDKILQKYEVKLENHKKLDIIKDRYTFQENGLYSEVKKRLLSKYSIKQLQNSQKTAYIGLILFFFWFLCLLVSGFTGSFVTALICGYLILPVTGIAHNFVHMKPSWFKYLYLVTGFTPKQWEIMHCLSHHQYTNTLLDYQLQAFQPIAYFIRILPQNQIFKIILLQFIYVIMIPMNIILKLIIIPIIKLQKPEWEYIVPLLQIVFLYILNNDITLSIKLFLTIHCFFGFIFTKVTFGGHRITNLWTQGCQQIRDFGQHSLYTCNDIYPELKGGFLSFLVMSGFNIHTVHHMFPTIDNEHLYKVNEILKEVCSQRNIKISRHTLFQSIASVYRNFFFRTKWERNQDVQQ